MFGRYRHLRYLVRFLSIPLLILIGMGLARAQTETGQIVGVVLDPNGAVIPGATVTIRSVVTGAERRTTTDQMGNYVVTNLLPAVYEVTVEAPGFAPAKRRVQVTVGSRVAVDFTLEVGRPVETVEVIAEAGTLVNTETQTVAQVIDARKIVELPTLTRNP